MATFDLGTERDDLQTPVLLPEDWYTFSITEPIVKTKNKKWKDGGKKLSSSDIEGAGENLVIQGRILSDEPEFNGRAFTKWLALPNPSDKDKCMDNGQPMKDWKLDQIYKWVEAFGGAIEGSQISLAEGMKTQVYIVQENNNLSGELGNSIGFQDPKPISSTELDEFMI